MIANWTSAAGVQFPGYISNLRIVSGAALYTTTFTPPTGPLQPIQGVTQAGLPYGTVLLLRNAPAPGRVLTQKFAGANSGQVLSFPPAAMTGYVTTLNAGYGQGTYVASASSEYSGLFAYAAIGSSGTWASYYANYTGAGPQYAIVFASTVDVNTNSYQGDWIQVQMPSSVIISSYQIGATGNNTKAPYKWWLLGSRDGVNWFLLDSRTGFTFSALQIQTFSISINQSFTYFRIVINAVSAGGVAELCNVRFNGTIESVNVTPDGRVGLGVVNPTRALEVAGDIVCSGTVSGGNPTMFKNRIINGNFDIWQRGTSFTNQAPGTYTTDRFCNNWDGTGATRTISRQSFTPGQTDVPGNPLYFYRFAQTVAGSGGLYNNCLIQHIEGVQTFAGQPIVVSFWARAFVGTVFIMSAMRQVFGTSGSADVDFSPTSQQTYVLTSNWQRYTFQYFVPSINGKTIGTAGDYLALYNYVNVNLIETIDITGVQLEKGTVATPFEVRPFATELALCQRYYETSYGPQTTPGTASQYQNFAIVKAISTSVVRGQVPFRISKRGNFNVGLASGSIYSYAGTLNRISNMGTGLTDVVLTTPTLSFFTSGWISIVDSATPFTVGETYIAGWAASAEL
jgi:hypothetical protein